ncbi:MAG TPA: DUF748 domain-containing protein, partial [Candidatus Polarisedimenticolia bacterium]|nr:DUF748 domain-containing protein [Candidatus Polarisedimenticolia bacterium]
RYRRPAITVLILLLLYTLFGFLLVPHLVRRQVVRMADGTLGLQARIERLRTNPYTFTLEAQGLALREPGGAELLSCNELFLDFELSSLFRWAWTFATIRLVEPRVEAVLLEDGGTNLQALLPPSAGPAETNDAGEAPALPRLVVHTFEIDFGRARFEDRTRPTPFRTMAGPVSFTLTDFSTLPDDDGDFAFEAELESGARFTWSGSLGVNPVRSQGRFTLTGGHLPITKRYLQQLLRFRVVDGRSDIGFDYAVSLPGEGMRIKLSDGSVAVRDLVVAPEDEEVELLRLPELRLSGIALDWPERVLAIDEIALSGARLAAWRNQDGSLNLEEHLSMAPEGEREPAATGSPAEPAEGGDPLAGWRFTLGRLAVDDAAIGLEDRTVDPPMQSGIDGVRLEIRAIDNLPGSTFEFDLAAKVASGGTAAADGRIGLLPQPTLDAAVTIDGLSLLPLQAYLAQLARVRIDSGALSLAGRLTSNATEQMAYRGAATLTDLACHDVRRDEHLIAIGRMTAADLLLQLTAARLRIAGIDLERPYGRLTIYEDGSTNIGAALAPGTGGDAAVAEGPQGGAVEAGLPLAIEVDEVRIRDGSADFADLSLPLPFASRIEELKGVVSEMATGGASARVDLEGTVDAHGLARVEGNLDLFAPDLRSDMAVAFRNVEMSRLSPYSRKFAGYEVLSGRLSLDLHYRITDRRVESENEILLERLTLGEKVDSPDAPNLPVKLAVAMLKDKQGNIELDIPVGGTLDDPEFAYGALVWKAIKTVMTKIVTAPFRALARLIGSDKDLEYVEFAPAGSDLAPPAREKIGQLGQALAERPELSLELRGVFDPAIDAAAIRRRAVDALVDGRLASLPQPATAEPALASERRRAALESLFVERFPQEDLDRLAASHTVPAGPPADRKSRVKEGDPVLDLPPYLDDIRERLIAAQPVAEADLAGLAAARAAVIRDALTSGGLLADERVLTLEGGPIEEKDAGNNWVRLKLVLGTK